MDFASLAAVQLRATMLLSVVDDQDITINIVQSNITLFSSLYGIMDLRERGASYPLANCCLLTILLSL
jgi:hypothetical protein